MIGGQQSVDLDVGVEELWLYMMNYQNWAEFVIGFQKLNVVDEKRAIWTLRGDVGILAREVDVQTDLVKLIPNEVAEFELTGLTERITGTGSFRVERLDAEKTGDAGPATASAPVIASSSWWQKFWFRVINRILSRRSGGKDRTPSPAPAPSTPSPARPAAAGSGERSRLTFILEVSPGGPMAPMLEILMNPMLKPAADDICTRIRNALGGES
ncbi:SRPBCC family protein [Nonomuraea sp. K274]|uniref:SRPBCC family protein n=1 Tax=Nonomuraea cypriaca TaxID=1187855 RepID=A0A931ABI6_9ACTN|nr:SRPBCC family protein [Nonomuraea cypriaca]MBF8186302.1 SRPBCC family protein [Nonomuraea cypriaca]